MAQERQDAKTIFLEALEREGGEARLSYLDEACADDHYLRAKVEGLLAAYSKAGKVQQRAIALGLSDLHGTGYRFEKRRASQCYMARC